MKKLSIGFLIIIALFTFNINGAIKYEEAKLVLEKMASSLEKFIGDLEKVENAEKVVIAFNSYSDVMEKLIPEIKQLIKKYPELKDEKKHPEELKPLTGKIEELAKNMMSAMVKIQPYMADPKVSAANQHFMQVMALLHSEEPKDTKNQPQDK